MQQSRKDGLSAQAVEKIRVIVLFLVRALALLFAQVALPMFSSAA
jgi:hypothetical protein